MNKGQAKQIILRAMKDRNPSLLRQLKAAGELESFMEERATLILDEIVSQAQVMADHEGYQKEKDPMQKAGIMNMALALAREAVLGSDLLEFPRGETSLSRRDEITPSETTT